MTTNRKRHLKSEFTLFQAPSILFDLNKFIECWPNFLGFNPKGPYFSLEKEKETFCVVFTYFIKRGHEIRKFHFVVILRWLRNVQKSVMHVQSCCCSRCCRHLRCLSFLLLWCKNFATMATWRHTSPLYHTSLFAMELNVSREITGKCRNHSFMLNNYVSQSLDQSSQTT